MKIKNERGITLITLIITIIIMLILAGVVITLTFGKNGLFKKLEQIDKIEIIAEMKEQLILALNKMQIDKQGEATLEDVTQESIENEIYQYKCNVKSNSLNSEKIVTMSKGKTTGKFLIDGKLNIIEIDNNDIELSYSIISRNENELNTVITIAEKQHNIIKIKCPNGEELTNDDNRKEIKIDYKVNAEIGAEYNFKILLDNGEEVEKTLVINKVLYSYTGSEQSLILLTGTYKIECYGARGGNGHGNSKGGYGGYTCGITSLSKDTQLYLYIGQAGQDGDKRRASFNGGAIGGSDNYYGTENGGSGGGATDIRLNQNLTSRIIVAGGGGGAGRMAF